MKIAIASGKGGTGKTTLSVAFALSYEQPVILLDCDVEEPNCNLFLNFRFNDHEDLSVLVPEIDDELCIKCGECARFCQFNSIASLGKKTIVFEDLCHNCGGCVKICPRKAISENKKIIGKLEKASEKNLTFVMGTLELGYPMSPPVIRAVTKHALNDKLNIIDSPPGTSCPMISAIQEADFVILVTEPTPFGLHDLKLAVQVVRKLEKKFAVIVNRCDIGDDRVKRFCASESIDILLEIKDQRSIAEAYSKGKTLLEAAPEYRTKIKSIIERITV